MADYTIAADEVGAYEVPIAAGNVVTFNVKDRGWHLNSILQLSVHEANMPVYAKVADIVTVKDSQAAVVMSGQWIELRTPYNTDGDSTIAVISAGDGLISLARA